MGLTIELTFVVIKMAEVLALNDGFIAFFGVVDSGVDFCCDIDCRSVSSA